MSSNKRLLTDNKHKAFGDLSNSWVRTAEHTLTHRPRAPRIHAEARSEPRRRDRHVQREHRLKRTQLRKRPENQNPTIKISTLATKSHRHRQAEEGEQL